jgi:hypothetical protein
MADQDQLMWSEVDMPRARDMTGGSVDKWWSVQRLGNCCFAVVQSEKKQYHRDFDGQKSQELELKLDVISTSSRISENYCR